jgi:NADH:ubiquinone oxidoreductase subunit 5 (subunit L)/multisubunit Na+/H+ antiporter MnhA subunit
MLTAALMTVCALGSFTLVMAGLFAITREDC